MRIHYEGNEKQKSHRVGNIVYPTSISFVRITGKQGDEREDKRGKGEKGMETYVPSPDGPILSWKMNIRHVVRPERLHTNIW